MDKLIARGFCHPNRCVMCYMDVESANHLLVHCPVARMIWNFFFKPIWVVLGYAGKFKSCAARLERLEFKSLIDERKGVMEVYSFCYLLGDLEGVQ